MKISLASQVTGGAVEVSVRTSGFRSGTTAKLQRKVGRRWVMAATGKLRVGKATLRWTRGTPGTRVRLRVQLRRGARVLITSRSLVVKVPAAATKPPAPSRPVDASTVPPAGQQRGPGLEPEPAPEPEPVPEIAPRRLSLGGTTGCRVDGPTDEVRCWGNGTRGQLGDGSRTWRAYADGVPGMTDVRAVAVGEEHACAARRDGTVWCWGDNFRKQLGVATTANVSASPVRVGGVTRVQSLVTGPGATFTCVNRLERAPLCWGTVPAGLLRGVSGTELATPTPVPDLTGATIVDLSASRLCVRWTSQATVECLAPNPAEWGRSNAGETHGSLAAVKEVSAGAGGSCALLVADRIRCEASAGYTYASPTGDLSDWTSPRVLELTVPGALDVGTGIHTACAARGAQTVRCWGSTAFVTATPFDVPGTAGVVSVESDGADGFCGADAAGAVRCWGAGYFPGTHGRTVAAPVPLELDGDLTAPAMSADMGCGIRNGAVECWGRTPGGDPTATYDGRRPTKIAGTDGVVEVAVALTTACGRRLDGTVLCWGWLPRDMTAPGVVPPRENAPATVVPDLDGVTNLDAGYDGICALREGVGRGIVCLGLEGRRGPWTPGSPRGIEPGTADARDFAVGDSLTYGYGPSSVCFVDTAPSSVRCLRDGSSTPVDVPGTAGAVGLELGVDHGCAIVAAGRVRCWGQAHGDLGFAAGARPDQRAETAGEVTGLEGVTELALGFGHSCAIVAPGDVWCWGTNDQGQLGQPASNIDTVTPQRVPRIGDARTLTSSVSTLCATRETHALTCWGSAWYSVPRPAESDWWLGARLIDERDLPRP